MCKIGCVNYARFPKSGHIYIIDFYVEGKIAPFHGNFLFHMENFMRELRFKIIPLKLGEVTIYTYAYKIIIFYGC